jgi:hypothetical protein
MSTWMKFCLGRSESERNNEKLAGRVAKLERERDSLTIENYKLHLWRQQVANRMGLLPGARLVGENDNVSESVLRRIDKLLGCDE